MEIIAKVKQTSPGQSYKQITEALSQLEEVASGRHSLALSDQKWLSDLGKSLAIET